MTNTDQTQAPTPAPFETKLVPLIVRGTRVFSGLSIAACTVPLIFVFPFLFDSPNASPPLILGIIFSIPLSFFLSSDPYKKSLVKGDFAKAFLFAAAPALLTGMYVVIGLLLNYLTPLQNSHKDAIIVGTERGELFIKTPENCMPSIYRTRYSVSGTWTFNDKNPMLTCDGTSLGSDSLFISEALPGLAFESGLKTYLKTVVSNESSEIYRFSKDGKVVAEITKFTAYDGEQVSVLHWSLSKTPTRRTVSRRLDDTFELTYSVDLHTFNQNDPIEIDRQIVEYTKSIVLRNK